MNESGADSAAGSAAATDETVPTLAAKVVSFLAATDTPPALRYTENSWACTIAVSSCSNILKFTYICSSSLVSNLFDPNAEQRNSSSKIVCVTELTITLDFLRTLAALGVLP